VSDWLKEQSAQFRAGIQTVVIDPSAPHASGIRQALHHARISDHRQVAATDDFEGTQGPDPVPRCLPWRGRWDVLQRVHAGVLADAT
jgi:hypothetical protein